jgi:hypothetical protein
LSSRDEKVTTAALALVGVAVAFVTVTWLRRPPSPPPMSDRDRLVSAYTSPTGFKPFTHLDRPPRESYVMLDVIPEDDDALRFIHVQVILPSQHHGLLWTYAQYRVKCREYVMQDLGESETVDGLSKAQSYETFYRPMGETFQNSGAYEACRYLKRI